MKSMQLQLLYLQHNAWPENTAEKWVKKFLQEPEVQNFCCKILSSIYDKKVILRKSQQYGHQNMTLTLTIDWYSDDCKEKSYKATT